jgi:hypothetical protein
LGVDSEELRKGSKKGKPGEATPASGIQDERGGYPSGNVVVRRVLAEMATAVEHNQLTEEDILLLGQMAERMRKTSPK